MSIAPSLLLAFALALPLGCSTRSAPEERASAAAPEPAAAAPAAEAAPEPAATAPAAEAAPGAEAAAGKKPLSHYLASAAVTKVYDTTDLREAKLVETLSKDDTRAYLATFDLEQVADGPLVKCPPTKLYAFEDGAGGKLGSISFCGGHARYDAPDGTFGGIEPPKAP